MSLRGSRGRGAGSGNQDRVNKVIRFYRIMARLFVTLLSAWFVKSLVSQLPYPSLADVEAYVVLKLGLVAYLYSYFLGSNRDLSVHNDILLRVPKPTVREFGLMVMMFVLFGLLLYVERPTLVAGLWLFFFVVDVLGGRYLQRLARPFVRAARETYRNGRQQFNIVKMDVYEDYFFGRWRWWRNGIGVLLLVMLAAVAFGGLPALLLRREGTAFALLVCLTVVVLESWIWLRRMKLKILWDALNWLEDHDFKLVPGRPPRPGP